MARYALLDEEPTVEALESAQARADALRLPVEVVTRSGRFAARLVPR